MRLKDWADEKAERIFFDVVAEDADPEKVIDAIAKSLRWAATQCANEPITGEVRDP